MNRIGFSTGSLAKGDFEQAVSYLRHTKADAVELSALREEELDPLINALGRLNLKQFKYISLHAPSKRVNLTEDELIEKLLRVKNLGYCITVHPDIIENYSKWMVFDHFLCIENMDKRKPIGRTAKDMERLFALLPKAGFCFDIAHARQVDPTMQEAALMLDKFKHRIKQIHLSNVNSESVHERLNYESIISFSRILSVLNDDVPVILESPIKNTAIKREMALVPLVFNAKKAWTYFGLTSSPEVHIKVAKTMVLKNLPKNELDNFKPVNAIKGLRSPANVLVKTITSKSSFSGNGLKPSITKKSK